MGKTFLSHFAPPLENLVSIRPAGLFRCLHGRILSAAKKEALKEGIPRSLAREIESFKEVSLSFSGDMEVESRVELLNDRRGKKYVLPFREERWISILALVNNESAREDTYRSPGEQSDW